MDMRRLSGDLKYRYRPSEEISCGIAFTVHPSLRLHEAGLSDMEVCRLEYTCALRHYCDNWSSRAGHALRFSALNDTLKWAVV